MHGAGMCPHMKLFRRTERFELTMALLWLGRDLNVCLYGGDAPHIGAVAIATPHVNPRDRERVEASSSLFTVPGHKEGALAQKVAQTLSACTKGVVSVSCGIHLDNATSQEIDEVLRQADSLLQETLEKISSHPSVVCAPVSNGRSPGGIHRGRIPRSQGKVRTASRKRARFGQGV